MCSRAAAVGPLGFVSAQLYRHVNGEDPDEQARPAVPARGRLAELVGETWREEQGELSRRGRLRSARDDSRAQAVVACEDPVAARRMEARRWDQGAQAPSVTSIGLPPAVGAIDGLWYNGPSGPLAVKCYVSATNADRVRRKRAERPDMPAASLFELEYWLVEFHEGSNTWYEAAYPKSPLTLRGRLHDPGDGLRVSVADEPTLVSSVPVYSLYFELTREPGSSSSLYFGNILPWESLQ